MIGFIMENIRAIGMIYLIVAVLTFFAVMAFFCFTCRAEGKERELYPDDKLYYQGDGDGGAGTAATMLIGFVIALGCAIMWWRIPLLLINIYIYASIKEYVTDDEREENKE